MGALNPDPVSLPLPLFHVSQLAILSCLFALFFANNRRSWKGKLKKDEHKEEIKQQQEGGEKKVVTDTNLTHHHTSRPVPTPIQVTVDPSTAAAVAATFSTPPPPQLPSDVTASTTLNSRKYTNRISLFLFLLHLLNSSSAVSFFIFKAIQLLAAGHSSSSRKEKCALQFWLPPIEGSAVLSIILAFAWQRSVLAWPGHLIINFVLLSTFGSTMSAGILLLCFAIPSASGLGVALILFSIGVSLCSC